MRPLWSFVILAWAAILLLGLAVSGLIRQVHLLGRAVAQLNSPVTYASTLVGEVAPPLTDQPGQAPISGPRVVLFMDSDCEACARVLPELLDLSRRLTTLSLTVVSKDDGASVNGATESIGVFSNSPRAFDRYRVVMTPFAVFIDGESRIRTARPVGSPELLRSFVEEANRQVSGREHANASRK